jgi:hypothetical protein
VNTPAEASARITRYTASSFAPHARAISCAGFAPDFNRSGIPNFVAAYNAADAM